MAKVATVIADYFEDIEYTSPKKALEEAGHSLVTINAEAGTVVTGKHGEKVTIDKGIGDVKVDDFDALFIPGGFSPDILRADDAIVAFTKAFVESGRPVFSICHGPQLLITADVLKGRSVTGYKSIVQDIKNAGANFKDEPVVVCGNQLVTSRTPDDLAQFNEAIVKILA